MIQADPCNLASALTKQGMVSVKKAELFDESRVVVHLDRPAMFRDIVQAISSEGLNYGVALGKRDKVAVINCVCVCDTSTVESPTLDHIRALLLSQHIASLLRANG